MAPAEALFTWISTLALISPFQSNFIRKSLFTREFSSKTFLSINVTPEAINLSRVDMLITEKFRALLAVNHLFLGILLKIGV